MSETLSAPFTKEEIDAIRQRARDEERLGADLLAKLRRVGRRLPFIEDLLAAYYCSVDPKTPARVKLILVGAIAYFILPIDGLPDLLPLIGFSDDAAVLAAAVTQVAGAISERHRERARRAIGAA